MREPTRDGAGPAGSPGDPQDVTAAVADLGYADAARELDAIVAFFEQREVDVDQLVAKLERATAIVGELDRRLNRTRVQVEELVPRLEAVVEGRGGPDADADAEDRDGTDQEEADLGGFDDELPLDEDEGPLGGGADRALF